MGIFAWQAPLNTLNGLSRKNEHLKVLIWGGGRGVSELVLSVLIGKC